VLGDETATANARDARDDDCARFVR